MEEVIFTTTDKVASLTINRPDDENRMTPALLEKLGQIAEALEKDAETQAVIISGAGSSFFSADIDITDPAAYEGYKPRASAALEKYGARILARAIRQRASRSKLIFVEGI